MCMKKREEKRLNTPHCYHFELSGMAAFFHGIETEEDFQCFHERLRKEQDND